jgi:hypothetical protein
VVLSVLMLMQAVVVMVLAQVLVLVLVVPVLLAVSLLALVLLLRPSRSPATTAELNQRSKTADAVSSRRLGALCSSI